MKGILREGKKSRDGQTDGEVGDTISEAEQAAMERCEDDFSSAELQEFLEADRVDVRADPEFKERLRETLWEMVKRMRRGAGDGT